MVTNKSIFWRNFANGFLCGSAVWAIARTNCFYHPILFSSYVHLLLHGLTDTMSPSLGSWKEPVLSKLKIISDLAPISLLNIQLLVTHSFKKELVLNHMISLVFPLLAEMFADEHSTDGLLLTQIASVCSLAFISHKTDNFYGSLAAACKFVDEVILQLFIFDDEEPPSTISNIFSTISRSLFCVFSALSV